jgi:hypothetical protein
MVRESPWDQDSGRKSYRCRSLFRVVVAVRRLVELGLTVKTPARAASRPGRMLRAAELAAKAIDKIADPGVPPDERADRQRHTDSTHLIKNPKRDSLTWVWTAAT